MNKYLTKFFIVLRSISDDDKNSKWFAIIIGFLFIIAFIYMKMIFGIIFLVYLAMVFSIFLFGKVTIIKETDNYVKRKYNLFNISIIVKDKK